jgi:photosystem II stability/assembly factor-like uncharacterized protein
MMKTLNPGQPISTLAIFALVLALAILVTPLVGAQEISESFYSAMKWRMIGPFRAGKVNAVAGIPGNPAVYYFGADGGGVWRTTDGGTVWKPIFDRQPVASIGALALAPSNPNIVYVGTGVNGLYGDISFGNGVYKSSDSGETWQHLGLEDSRHIARILIDPRNPDIVLVAAMGHSFGPNEERGVFRSTDGGKTWRKVLYKDAVTGAVDLCFEPGNPRVVYATLWHGIRKPGQKGTAFGPGSGLYKSTDEGITWTQIAGHGLPAGDWGRSGVAAAPRTRGRRVYLIVEAKDQDGGLYRSDDAGATWQHATTDKRIDGYWYMSEIFVDPKDPDVVYVPTQSLYRSTDGGHTFTAIKGAPGGDDYHTVWIDPTDSQRIILGVDQGATISVDGGASWSPWYNQPTGQFYRVATDHRFPYWVYGPQQDSGTAGIASRGNNGEITERDWSPVGPGESGYTIPDPLDPDVVYNAGPGGSVVRLSRTTGQVRDISPAPVPFGTKYHFNWTIPMAFSPQDPHALYLGTQFLLKTTNGGTSWQAISGDLTRVTPNEKNHEQGGTILTIAPSEVREGLIWVGTDDGNIQITKNGGAGWQNVTPPALSAWSMISMLEASHFDAGTAFAAVSRNSLDDLNPHIFRTHDFGQSWLEVVNGISDIAFVRVVREDPVRKGLVYAGTERGVFVSFDEGDHWQPLRLNMPMVAIHDLAVEQDDLVAATYGRSFWILDDVTPLRQLNARLSPSEAHLFEPRPTIRIRRDENQDTPLPPEVPAGQNPPDGAMLYYFLPEGSASEIQLEIYDSNRTLVRGYSSLAQAHKEQADVPFIAAYWIGHPAELSREPGVHRFVWDLRYPDPPAVHVQSPYNYPIAATVGATPLPPQGPLVLPGNYEVRLKVGEQILRQPLQVKMDPRISAARNELQSSLDLQLKISAALGRNFAAYEQAKDLRVRLGELRKRPKDDRVAKAATELDAKVAAVEGEAIPILETPKAVSFMTVNDSLTALMALVDGADSAPSEESFAAYRRLCAGLNETLGAWQDLKSKDLPGLNALLTQNKLVEIPQSAALTNVEPCGN